MKRLFFSLSHRLTLTYLLSLGLLALLAIGGQWEVRRARQKETNRYHVIYLSGRQRMLSQQITELALLIERKPTLAQRKKLIEKLATTLQAWKNMHYALQQGDTNQHLPGDNSVAITQLFAQITPFFQEIVTQTERLVATQASTETINQTAIDVILKNEPEFLRGMDRITFQYSREARESMEAIEKTESLWLIIILLTLLAEGLFIFRPTIRRLVSYLSRLTEANKQLNELNTALEAITSRQQEMQGRVEQALQQEKNLTEKSQRAEADLRKNQQFITAIIETLPDTLYIYDLAEAKNVFSNQEVSSILGYSAEEKQAMGNQFLAQVLHPDDQEKIHEQQGWFASAKDKAVLNFEYRMKHRDGHFVWLSSREVVFTRNAEGMPVQALGIVRDISEIKRANNELGELKDLLSSVLDNSPTGIMAFKSLRNAGGQIEDFELILVNKTFERTVNQNASQLIGNRLTKVFLGAGDAYLFDLYKQVVETGAPLHRTHCYESQPATLWLQLTAAKMGDGFVVTSQDVTEQKNIAGQLDQQREFYETILAQLPSDIVVLDPDQRYMFANAAAVRDEGTRQWLIGKDDFEYCSHQDKDTAWAEQRAECFRRAVEQKNQVEWEDYHTEPNGKVSYYLRRFSPVLDAGGNLACMICYGLDITDRKAMEQELASQQAFIRQVLDSSPSLVFVKDWEGRFVFANQAMARSYDKTVQEVLGRIPADLSDDQQTTEQLLEQEREVIRRGMAGNYGHVVEYEWKYNLHEQRNCCYHVIKVPFIQADGLIQLLGIATDITERKEADNKLVSSQKMLAESQRIARMGSWELDLENTGELTWSEETFRITGLEPTDKAPSFDNYLAMLHPEDALLLRTKIRKAMNDGNPYEVELRLNLPGQSTRYTLARGQMEWDNGRPVRLVGILQDVTDRKLIEMELVNAKEGAELSMKAKEMFLSTMSHEIRTPMNAVIGMTHLLLEESPKPEQIHHLQTLQFSAQNLLVLINDILDFSKIESGKIAFEEIDFNLLELSNSIRNSLKFSAEEKGIRFTTFLDSEAPPIILGDPVRLSQILTNLVSNAVKFTEQGSVEMDVRVLSQGADSVELEFSVADTGIGIPSDKLEYIFEIFTQANSDTTRKYGGTGLGLTITKRLLELQGSQIKVMSTPGKGSRFYFTLPFKKSLKKIACAANHYDTTKLEPLNGVQLLLVEDMPANQLIATKFLNKWGIKPDYAVNGEIAVEKVQQKAYDFVLMDLEMPVMDGYQATRNIRSLAGEQYQRLPIVALTASAMADIREKVMGIGMTDYLTKPFNPNELHGKIAKYTSRHVEKPAEPIAEPVKVAKKGSCLSFEGLEALTEGNRAFRKELTTLHVRSFDEFSKKYQTALLNHDEALLRSTIHKIHPALVLLDTQQLKEEIEHGKKLSSSQSPDLKELELSIEKVNEISRQIIDALSESLKTL